MKISSFFAVTVGLVALSAHAENMTECQVSVSTDSSVTITAESTVMNDAILKTSEVKPGESRFVFLLTGAEGRFSSFFQLQSDESAPSSLDFKLTGYEDRGVPLIGLSFMAMQAGEWAADAFATMYWNKNDKDLGETVSYGTTVFAKDGAVEKDVLLTCGPVGWTDSLGSSRE